jgi:hypothetical protein
VKRGIPGENFKAFLQTAIEEENVLENNGNYRLIFEFLYKALNK